MPGILNPANFSPRWLWRSPGPANIPEVLDPVTFEPPINLLQTVVDSIAEAQELRPDSAEACSSLGSHM